MHKATDIAKNIILIKKMNAVQTSCDLIKNMSKKRRKKQIADKHKEYDRLSMLAPRDYWAYVRNLPTEGRFRDKNDPRNLERITAITEFRMDVEDKLAKSKLIDGYKYKYDNFDGWTFSCKKDYCKEIEKFMKENDIEIMQAWNPI